MTYNEACEAKITDLHIAVVVNEDIVTFDIAMHDAEIVHVEVDAGAVKSDLDTNRHWKLDISLHVKHGKKTIVHELVDYHNVWDGWAAAHEKSDVRVPQDALHYNLVLNLHQ